MTAGITDKLRKYKSLFSTTLSTSIGTGTSDTITLASVTGLPTDTAITLTFDRVDSGGVATPTKLERIRGIISGGNFTAYVRGKDGTTEQAHTAGAVIEMIWNADDLNDMVDWANTQHNQDGTHGAITSTNASMVTASMVTPTINAGKFITSINDANGNEVIKTPATASAVNEVTVTNSATGNAVQVSATGGDTNIDLKLVAKGTGGISDKNGDYLSPNSSLSRQAIINGNFDVWQRGTSFTLGAARAYTADRWYAGRGATATGSSVTQQDGTGVSGSRYCARVQRVAANAGTDIVFFSQGLETTDSIKFRGKKVTISFYARKGANYSATSDVLVSVLYTGTGTDENPLSYTGSATAVTANNTLTTDWQKFTITTSAVIGATVTEMGLWLQYTPVGTAGAADYFEIAQVQLCAGDVALPFQPKSYNQELIDCQRYTVDMLGGSALANIIVATGECNSTTRVYSSIQMPVTMRIAPTLVAGTASNFSVGYWTGGNIALTAMSLNIATPQMVLMNFDVAAGLTANYPARIFRPGTDEKLLFTAEL